MFRPSFPPASPDVAKRIAFCVAASPAVLVIALFIVRPEALGSPATKLALMTLAGCMLMRLGDLSRALTRWLPLTVAPESTRFG
ncbi:MAG TPA: hypothetical protein VM686_20060 [Polyangiaceae bacterium]|jgi:hypothetical protein|nr:hypothetical protein [Polyangiaceae bacterium]